MSDENRQADFLSQMREAATDALRFVDGIDRDDFLNDLLRQRAVVMCLMIIGEAANRITADHPAFAEANPEIPWHKIRGMRNRIAHGYFDIDLAVVWQTVQAELPPLVAQLTKKQV